jgi:hypothetical protein
MTDKVETYRGIEIFENVIPASNGGSPFLKREFVFAAGGKSFYSRTLDELKRVIDGQLAGGVHFQRRLRLRQGQLS